MRHFPAYFLLPLLLLLSCGKEQQPGQEETASPQLTVLIGTDGFGDGCYNDNILSGILRFCEAHPEVELNLQQPSSIADAGKRLDAWLKAEGSADRALILASNSYEGILKGKSAPENGRVLILETDESFPGHSSYIIRRYGASWLCGSLSEGFTPFIVKAMDGNDMIDESAEGFQAGYKHVSGGNVLSGTVADGPEGFAMRDSTYRFVYKVLQGTEWTGMPLIFPLVGGAISGAFDYQRYMGFTLVAGMDLDCTPYAPQSVPFSLLINNNRVLERYLQDWLAGTAWPEHETFGLESEYVQVKLNPAFQWGDLDLQALYGKYYPSAVEKEHAYAVE